MPITHWCKALNYQTALTPAYVHPSPCTIIMCEQNHCAQEVKTNIKQDSEDKRYHRLHTSQLGPQAGQLYF